MKNPQKPLWDLGILSVHLFCTDTLVAGVGLEPHGLADVTASYRDLRVIAYGARRRRVSFGARGQATLPKLALGATPLEKTP